MKYSNEIVLFLLVVILPATPGVGEEPEHILPFQGHLTQPKQGNQDRYEPVPNGTYTVLVSLYTTPEGGQGKMWGPERHEDVPVINGLVNLLIGSKTPFPEEADFFGRILFVGISIDEDNDANTPDLELVPRQQYIPALFAQRAKHAGLADRATNADHAMLADKATQATKADSASKADVATRAENATTANNATNADTAASAKRAEIADSADAIAGVKLALVDELRNRKRLVINGYPNDDRPLLRLAAYNTSVTGSLSVNGTVTAKAVYGVSELFGPPSGFAAGRTLHDRIDVTGGMNIKNGGLTVGGRGVQLSSSRKLKRNIQRLSYDEARDSLAELLPSTFVLLESQEREIGFIAEEVPANCGTHEKDAVKLVNVVAVLTRVIKEQQSQIETLKQKMQRIENARSDRR
ncbi:tail fiber domain-containing protein [Aporhodopirellula aestuarii]|uniref:Tail fiber domain-containing protein n=1 Tax=Aporhodopirellula aestuarii TaxID=2950107 RepID=A0ABT0UE14_9BACT|nr:tail fiber domain-containing protein [Aporhodopirellula aestuarii]MCM2374710.1 tail fiber domain-containing protein [Aporhodopirellula aestuarii]